MIECTKYKAVNKGSLAGFADLYLPGSDLEIYGCAVFRSNGREWVAMPSKEVVTNEGLKKYYAYVRFRERTRMDAFSHEAMQAIRPHMQSEMPIFDTAVNDVPF